MTPLDFISLEEAKQSLVVHPSVTEFDGLITDLVYSAVEWVEKWTNHMLYEREITQTYTNGNKIFYYPLTLPEIEGTEFVTNPLSKTVCISSGRSVDVTMTVGYDGVNTIAPRALKSACYDLITYWYDNRESEGIDMPQNVQFKLNQFRRDASI